MLKNRATDVGQCRYLGMNAETRAPDFRRFKRQTVHHPWLRIELEWLSGGPFVRSALIWRVDGVAVAWLDAFEC